MSGESEILESMYDRHIKMLRRDASDAMSHSTQEECEAYERMLERNSSPLVEEQRIMRRTNRLMAQLGRMREENSELRELVELMWQTHCGPPTAYGWVAVMEEAERLGINLEYQK